MNKKYIVRLTAEERKELENLVNKGKTQAYRTPLIPIIPIRTTKNNWGNQLQST